jgi:phosphoglycerate dehydrogenase-like enzyme
MNQLVKAALPVTVQKDIGQRLPSWVVPAWFGSRAEGLAVCADAEIGWLDLASKAEMSDLIETATCMRWFNTQFVGLDAFPVETLRKRNVVVTNGAGLGAITIAEYVVLAMLTVAKGYRDVVRAQDRHEWLTVAPGKMELGGSRALVIGYGAIGQGVASRLKAFDVDVTVVRRTATGQDGILGPLQWRARLGEFDWVILALPATDETARMIGASELRAMKPSAVLLNFARGTLIDQDALIEALKNRSIGSAFLDVTDPEPLPPSHELWGLDNAHISMHLSGRSQTRMQERAVDRFLANVERYRAGLELTHTVDLVLGY